MRMQSKNLHFKHPTLIFLLSFFFFSFSTGTAIGQDKKNGSVLTINIDNPTFRPLTMAIPKIGYSDKKLASIAVKAQQEFESLLQFSGYFKILNSELTKEVMSEVSRDDITGKASLAASGTFRKLGAEAATFAYIERDSQNFLKLSIKTVDLISGKRVLGKRYEKIADIKTDLRSFADHLLESYTGRPGIFTSRILFVGRKSKGSSKQVYLCDFDGGNLIALTNQDTIHTSPSWSPDGKKVVFTSFASGNADLYVLDIKTGKRKRITSHPGTDSGGSFSPDGKLITYTNAINGNSDIFFLNLGSNTRVRLIQGPGLDVEPVFSPNYGSLLYVSGRYGNPHIFRADLQWNAKRSKVKVMKDTRLTFAGWYNATPSWSSDGKKIAFAGFDKETNRFDIFMMNPDGTKLERLTLKTADNEHPSWAPNDQLLVFQSNRIGTSDQKGRSQLFLMNRDGSFQRRIETGLYEALSPRWSPASIKK